MDAGIIIVDVVMYYCYNNTRCSFCYVKGVTMVRTENEELGTEGYAQPSLDSNNLFKMKNFSVRIPNYLLDSIRGLVSNKRTASDLVRLSMEKTFGLDGVDTMKEYEELQRDNRASLERLVSKVKTNSQFSRAEIMYVANECHSAYSHKLSKYKRIKNFSIVSNLLAFNEMIKLRDATKPMTEEANRLDHYYHGCLGRQGRPFESSIDKHVHYVVNEIFGADYVHPTSAEMAARCFEVASRDEPELSICKLNDAIRPFMENMILFLLRVYYIKNGSTAVKIEGDFAEPKMIQDVLNESFWITPMLSENGLICAVELREKNVVFSLNNTPEIDDFVAALRSARQDGVMDAVVGRFHCHYMINSVSPQMSTFFISVGGCRMFMKKEEYDGLCDLFETFMKNENVSNARKDLMWVYGDI